MGEIIRGRFEESERRDQPPIYKPSVIFANDGLHIAFDHDLKAKPDQLYTHDGPRIVTAFFIHPDQELYIGLQFVPRQTLAVVSQGLKTYLIDETLTDQERTLIEDGILRINRFVFTGDRGKREIQMSEPEDNRWDITPELAEDIESFSGEHEAEKRNWLLYHRNRSPINIQTGEEGIFVGIFGYLTSTGVRNFPYYQTKSGIHFYESVDSSGENKKQIELDIEEIKEKQIAHLYTAEEWLGGGEKYE